MLDRQARLSSLRAKLHASTRANRRDILSEQSRSRTIASDLNKPSYSRKLAKASTLLEERDLREAGEDVERHRNMSFSLEDSERWDNKLAEKAKRKDQGPGDFSDAAERAYQRQVRLLKPNLSAYEKGKEERDKVKANSPATGALVRKGKAHGEEGEGIHYGTHRPSDDAIDRVVQHLNHEKQIIQNRSRRRAEDPDSEVNYINDGNKHFNKKLKRFYDGQTKEIRENRKYHHPSLQRDEWMKLLTELSFFASCWVQSREELLCSIQPSFCGTLCNFVLSYPKHASKAFRMEWGVKCIDVDFITLSSM